jgi:hypothetical protein
MTVKEYKDRVAADDHVIVCVLCTHGEHSGGALNSCWHPLRAEISTITGIISPASCENNYDGRCPMYEKLQPLPASPPKPKLGFWKWVWTILRDQEKEQS